MRRPLLLLSIVMSLVVGPLAGPTIAQDGTPTAANATFAETLGLPELSLTTTDDAIEGVPAETAAGRYLVTVTNEGTTESAAGFVQLPAGIEIDDLAPPAGAEGSPTASGDGEGDGVELDWLFDAYAAGGTGAAPGGSAQAIVDLLPGNYAVWADDPEAPQAPQALTVTGEMPLDLPEPEADVTITEVGTAAGYAFELSGELAPGPQVIRVDNKSDQPHFLASARSPEPITMDQLEALLTFDPESGATPPPDMPNPDEFITSAYAAVQSAGTTQWIAADLEAGQLILVCFVPDPNNAGIPHAMEGMAEIVEVGDA